LYRQDYTTTTILYTWQLHCSAEISTCNLCRKFTFCEKHASTIGHYPKVWHLHLAPALPFQSPALNKVPTKQIHFFVLSLGFLLHFEFHISSFIYVFAFIHACIRILKAGASKFHWQAMDLKYSRAGSSQ
jgi:hypothetical protein